MTAARLATPDPPDPLGSRDQHPDSDAEAEEYMVVPVASQPTTVEKQVVLQA